MATARSSSASPERHALGALLFASVVAALTGCGGTGEPAPAALGPIAVTTESGALALTVQMTPDPPTVGVNTAVLELAATSDGSPRDGAPITLVPWMPAHGHGASVKPTIEALGDGAYQVTNVVFFMAGRWELRATIGEGDAADHAVAIVNVR